MVVPGDVTDTGAATLPSVQLSAVPAQPVATPTLNPVPDVTDAPVTEHIVQAGDTLFEIAQRYNTSLDNLLATNNLENPDLLTVGQVIILPDTPVEESVSFKIIPDSRLVRSPGSNAFDIAAFIAAQPGFIRQAQDTVTFRVANGAGVDRELNAAQIVEQVALEYSVDPRLLLILLEYSAGWLSNPVPSEELQTHPLVSEANSQGFDRSGLYRQLAWAANQLNYGYYGWKHRGLRSLEFEDGKRLTFAAGLNPGTIAVQYFLSLYTDYANWLTHVSAEGLYRFYYAYFGDPFQVTLDVPLPANLQQPALTLPFGSGEVWYYTGGPHGGWGWGSAWSALDFAPPDERTSDTPFCFTSDYAVRAVAPGIIARSNDGTVVLDMDGDGNEATGWTILYLHLAEEGRIAAGTRVVTGDTVGYAACSGGFSTATHLHIGRRFNGEWLPVSGEGLPPFVMSGWQAIGIAGQEYQGYLRRGDTTLQAEQGRNTIVNRVSWEAGS